MKIVISPKDTTAKMPMEVDFYWQEGNCLCVRFKDGRIRMYPMCHIWYLETDEFYGATPTGGK